MTGRGEWEEREKQEERKKRGWVKREGEREKCACVSGREERECERETREDEREETMEQV